MISRATRRASSRPLSIDYHGLTVHKLGPWSQGPMLLQTLRLLERIDVAAMDPLGPEFVHTLVEALKLGFADREVFYGDPDVGRCAARDAAVGRPMRRRAAS